MHGSKMHLNFGWCNYIARGHLPSVINLPYDHPRPSLIAASLPIKTLVVRKRPTRHTYYCRMIRLTCIYSLGKTKTNSSY